MTCSYVLSKGVLLCLSYFSNSSCEVLNKKLAEVVQGVELTGLRYEERNGGNGSGKAEKIESWDRDRIY